MFRLTASSATSGTAYDSSFNVIATFQPGDAVWGDLGPVQGGTAAQLNVECNSGGSITVDLYDRPAAPASFSGVSTSASTSGEFVFTAIGSGQYVADVSLSEGAIQLANSYGPFTTVASSEEVPLGSLPSGQNTLYMQGLDGPAADYSVTLLELPVEVSRLAFTASDGSTPAWVAPGTVLTGGFSVSGDTTISAYVHNQLGQVVRHLGSFFAKEGATSVTWDTRGDGGATLPDGAYSLHLDSTDPAGMRRARRPQSGWTARRRRSP